ncbi:MAG: hypothetical protein FWE87_05590, partial [Coriobacteriia bacterium]|nr:hypothetical protein [Coriobacteriia bacterium]
ALAHGATMPQITWDTTKPNGTARKLLDSSRAGALGWKPTVPFREGIEKTYQSYLSETGQ